MIDSQFKRIKAYDNGGKTFDRYTVIYLDDPHGRNMFGAVGMSANPFHPQGFGQHTVAMAGRHLGKRIDSTLLPRDCQILIKKDLGLV